MLLQSAPIHRSADAIAPLVTARASYLSPAVAVEDYLSEHAFAELDRSAWGFADSFDIHPRTVAVDVTGTRWAESDEPMSRGGTLCYGVREVEWVAEATEVVDRGGRTFIIFTTRQR